MPMKDNPSARNRKLVAIAVPGSNRDRLTRDEEVSLNHLLKHLGHYDRYLVVPPHLRMLTDQGFEMLHFGPEYFGSAKAHCQLLFSKAFYQAFADYEYLLIYHLDALVFSDQLEYWCRRGFDYIAPPWIPHKDAVYSGNPGYEGKVGNGGFSLRKIGSFLRVLDSKRLYKDPVEQFRRTMRSERAPLEKTISALKTLAKFSPYFNGVRQELADYRKNEDHFWANRARHYYPGFNIAPVETALRFAFECVPRFCFEKNGRTLPFGCHAWPKYDRDFWEPYLISS
ncbi:MAG: DUF5672 family protein [Desulfobacterales bacterium]